ncbi:hypothetical protein HN587_00680 [Candidatus Woesearchaeota archaeon]|nr:hypothetical protein [Candidatus Woesearchaeota archaeon]
MGNRKNKRRKTGRRIIVTSSIPDHMQRAGAKATITDSGHLAYVPQTFVSDDAQITQALEAEVIPVEVKVANIQLPKELLPLDKSISKVVSKQVKPIISSEAAPVWEWRTFEEIDCEIADKLLALPDYNLVSGEDVYLAYEGIAEFNVKVRDDKLKIKQYLYSEGGLEFWADYSKTFPIQGGSFEKIRSETKLPIMKQMGIVTLDDLLGLAEESSQVEVVRVNKKRVMKLYKGCGIDLTLVSVSIVQNARSELNQVGAYNGGVGLVLPKELEHKVISAATVGIESQQKEQIHEVLDEFGLRKYAQQNYSGFLKQLIQ